MDKHFPQDLVPGKRLESIRDECIQLNDAIGDLGREVGLEEQSHCQREIDFADHAIGRYDAHFTRHNLPQW